MKRIKRDPEKFEVIDLFTAIGREQGYKLSVPGDVEKFIGRISRSLQTSQDNPILIHGKRVESLFAHVAGALGHCVFIKHEDSGETFSTNQNIIAPDYKVVLKTGEQFFIEVKNCHSSSFKSLYSFDKDYLGKLDNYAKLQVIPLKFAIYFSRFNKWFLLSKESLIEQKKRYVIDFVTAMARNEMSLLGDRTIATEPNLSIELLADEKQTMSINEQGEASFIISDVKMYCAGMKISNSLEKSIAFYLIRFGSWNEQECEAIMHGDKFAGARFTYSPDHRLENQRFSMIGELSSMISSAYREQTVYERSVVAIDTKLDPEVFSVEIPNNYIGERLPLWQFTMRPNPDFNG